jgi:hypothetical protein
VGCVSFLVSARFPATDAAGVCCINIILFGTGHSSVIVPVEGGLGQQMLPDWETFVRNGCPPGLDGCQTVPLDLPVVLAVPQHPGSDRLHGVEHPEGEAGGGAHDGCGSPHRLPQKEAVRVRSGHDAGDEQVITRPHPLDDVVHGRIGLDDGEFRVQVLRVKVRDVALIALFLGHFEKCKLVHDSFGKLTKKESCLSGTGGGETEGEKQAKAMSVCAVLNRMKMMEAAKGGWRLMKILKNGCGTKLSSPTTQRAT